MNNVIQDYVETLECACYLAKEHHEYPGLQPGFQRSLPHRTPTAPEISETSLPHYYRTPTALPKKKFAPSARKSGAYNGIVIGITASSVQNLVPPSPPLPLLSFKTWLSLDDSKGTNIVSIPDNNYWKNINYQNLI